MRVVARRRERYCHDIEIEGGHTIVVDEPIEAGGSDAGPSPTRLLAASLASCTAITVEMYAERKGWAIDPVEVAVEVSYDGPVPSAFEVELRVGGSPSEEQLARLREIAARCPVHRVLTGAPRVAIADRIERL
jgi:putative redox protein